MIHPNSNVPVSIVAAELATTADELAGRLGAAVTLDNIGIRCIPVEVARDLIAARRAAVQAERPHPIRQRAKALAAAQEKWDGVDAPAIVRKLADDPDNKHNRSSRNLDEMMSGELVQHRRKATDR